MDTEVCDTCADEILTEDACWEMASALCHSCWLAKFPEDGALVA